MTRVALLDYGMGNLRSVAKALERVGASVDVVTSLHDANADGAVVPGQGAFGSCRVNLDRSGSTGALREWIAEGRPYLGICLGLQILFESSEESPEVAGLGVLPGVVSRLPGTVKVPHIGWNEVRFDAGDRTSVFDGFGDKTYFYFDHSYAPPSSAADAGWTDHGVEFTCAVASGSAVAVQFHPEKSGDAGLSLLERFVKGCVA